MKIVDLTTPLSPETPVFPGDPPVRFTPLRSHAKDGYEVSEIYLGTHSGTHIEAPRHLVPDGKTIDQFPVDRLLGPGVVINCRVGPGRLIEAEFLAERLRLWPVPMGGFALLWTEGSLLTAGAAELLLDAKVFLVGTDAPSLDTEPYPVHRLLLSNGVLLVENLCHLDELGPGPVQCAFLPLAAVGLDAVPVRAVAWR